MSEELASLITPLLKIIELFREVNKNDLNHATFREMIRHDAANRFYVELAKRIAEYHRTRKDMDTQRKRNKLFYGSLVASVVMGVAALFVAGTLGAMSYLKNDAGTYDIWPKRTFLIICMAVVVMCVILVHFAVLYYKDNTFLDNKKYKTDLEEPILTSIYELLQIDGTTVSRNYILYIYLSLYENNNVEFDNDPCSVCSDNMCSTVGSFEDKCNASMIAKQYTELQSIVMNIFENLDEIEAAVSRKDTYTQSRHATKSMQYIQRFMLKAMQDTVDTVLTQHEIEKIVKDRILPILMPPYMYAPNRKPMLSGRPVDVSSAPTDITETACMLNCIKDANCSMAFYNTANKCVLYKRDIANIASGNKAVFQTQNDVLNETTTLMKLRDEESLVNTHGCLKNTDLTTLKKSGLQVCYNENECSRYILDDMAKKFYGPLVNRPLDMCGVGASAIVIKVEPLADVVQDDLKRSKLHATVTRFKDVIYIQLVDEVERYGSTIDMASVRAISLSQISALVPADVFSHLNVLYDEVFDLANKEFEVRKKRAIDPLGNQENTQVISYDDFKAKFIQMNEKSFIEDFCLHMNSLRESSKSLIHFFSKHEITLERTRRTIEMFNIIIMYSIVLTLLGLTMYAINEDVGELLKDPLFAAQKYIFITGIMIVMFSFAFAYYYRIKGIHEYNMRVITENGNIVKSQSHIACSMILMAPSMITSCVDAAAAAQLSNSGTVAMNANQDAAQRGDLMIYKRTCSYSEVRLLHVTDKHEEMFKSLYTSMIRINNAITECNSVMFLNSIKMPFPYFEISMNAAMAGFAALVIGVVIFKFKLLTRLADIKQTNILTSKLKRGIRVPENDLVYYTKDDTLDPFLQQFITIAGIGFFCLIVVFMSIKSSQSSSQLKSGLFNSTYYNKKKCYKM